MSISSTGDILDAVSQHGLLNARQIEEIRTQVLPKCSDLKTMARELVQRGYLTSFQVNKIVKGKAQDRGCIGLA